MLRVWMMEAIPPSRRAAVLPGRWVAEPLWPSDPAPMNLALTGAGGLAEDGGPSFALAISSPEDTGMTAGYQCSYGIGPDLSDDQAEDDRRSLCFDSAPLERDIELLGEPVVQMRVSSDEAQAQIAVRLCAIAPDGSSLRMCYGVLNLANPHGVPRTIVPGAPFDVEVPLMALAQAVPAGHRLRIAISTAYWPILWPSPVQATVTVHSGKVRLPLRVPRAEDDALRPFEAPECAAAEALEILRPPSTDRPLDEIRRDPVTGSVTLIRTRDRGAWRTTDTDVAHDETGEMRLSLHPDQPLSAVQEFNLVSRIGRPGWQTTIDSTTSLSCDPLRFRLQARIAVRFEGEALFERAWDNWFDRA
jgi:hypothetical protein